MDFEDYDDVEQYLDYLNMVFADQLAMNEYYDADWQKERNRNIGQKRRATNLRNARRKAARRAANRNRK